MIKIHCVDGIARSDAILEILAVKSMDSIQPLAMDAILSKPPFIY